MRTKEVQITSKYLKQNEKKRLLTIIPADSENFLRKQLQKSCSKIELHIHRKDKHLRNATTNS